MTFSYEIGNVVGEENLQHLFYAMEMGKMPHLRYLNLSGISLKNKPSIYLASCIRSNAFKYLEALYLEQCELNIAALEHISCAIVDCPLQMLRKLSVAHNNLNTQALQLLSLVFQKPTLPSLDYLNLSFNHINDDGINELNNRYEDSVLTQVQTLDLSDNHIGNNGAFTIFDNIRHRQWSSLQELNLQKNKYTAVTGVQLRSLLEMDNQLETIHLTDTTKRRLTIPLYRHAERMGETIRRTSQSHVSHEDEGFDEGDPHHEDLMMEFIHHEEQKEGVWRQQDQQDQQDQLPKELPTKVEGEGLPLPETHVLQHEGNVSPIAFSVCFYSPS